MFFSKSLYFSSYGNYSNSGSIDFTICKTLHIIKNNYFNWLFIEIIVFLVVLVYVIFYTGFLNTLYH